MTCDEFRRAMPDVLDMPYELRVQYIRHFESCDYCQEEVMKCHSLTRDRLSKADMDSVVDKAVEDAMRHFGRPGDKQFEQELRAHIQKEMESSTEN